MPVMKGIFNTVVHSPHHEAHVGLVDAHAERDGGDDDPHVPRRPPADRVVTLHRVTLLSKHIQLMAASIVHVTNLTPPGSDSPTCGRLEGGSFRRTRRGKPARVLRRQIKKQRRSPSLAGRSNILCTRRRRRRRRSHRRFRRCRRRFPRRRRLLRLTVPLLLLRFLLLHHLPRSPRV
jgi:hypothetical protein